MIARHITRHNQVQIVDMVGPVDGLRMSLNLADEFQALMSIGAYQPDLIDELHKLIRQDDVVLTAGAHVGYMMLAMAKMGAKVIGFECDPNLVEMCRRNLELNSLDTMLIPVGLGSTETELELNVSSSAGQSSFSIAHHFRDKQTVKVRRGDDVLREIGIDHVDGLLIDVEGWECHLLEGLRNTLSRHAPRWAIIECFEVALENAGSSASELREMISSFGLSPTLKGGDLICRATYPRMADNTQETGLTGGRNSCAPRGR